MSGIKPQNKVDTLVGRPEIEANRLLAESGRFSSFHRVSCRDPLAGIKKTKALIRAGFRGRRWLNPPVKMTLPAAISGQRTRLGDVVVFENRQPEPLLNKVTKDGDKKYSLALFVGWN